MRPRVLHLIDADGPGGAQESLSILLRHADQAAFDLHLALLHGGGPAAGRLDVPGVTVHRLGAGRLDPRIPWRLFLLLRRLRPDVLHTHLAVSDVLGGLLGRAGGAAAVVAHARSEDPFRFQQRWLGPLDALAARRADANLAVSRQVADFLVRGQGVAPAKVRVVENAAEPPVFPLGRAGEGRRFRERFGIPPGAWLVGVACRLDPNKGLAHLLEAARELSAEMPDLALVVAGEGPFRPELERMIRDPGLSGRVVLTGFLPRVACGDGPGLSAMFAALDAYALPSYFEGFPVSVLEAMSAGVPVVATEVAGLAGNFTHGRDILFVPQRDAAALAGALRGLRARPAGEREAMTAAAAGLVRSRFSPSRVAAEVEAIYRGLVAGGSATATGRR